MKYFVTAIGTDSGKTLVSAIITKALNASYWKPIQAGFPTDTDTIKDLLPNVNVIQEHAVLSQPMSPHGAADIDEVVIKASDLSLPEVKGNLIVEGAGGLLVPINDKETVADVIDHLDIPVILVINLYLGCINHSLLTINELKRRDFKVAGIVFNGEGFEEARSFIENYSPWPVILTIPQLEEVNAASVEELAEYVQL